eukprot:CAMPEP_0172387096 /NCGR_PEP_ID=MMETSP1061-20121228/4490_1 /TAXON_ID=37318 /ORGANISM="Pseudo-nitzschia pungens, Strain cf. pungens" /LENGTH=345 /DNA_ID=CAMNT_0013116663 /DNA_START=87 /DNA_END=1124 /DNA_ORIENTATION=-
MGLTVKLTISKKDSDPNDGEDVAEKIEGLDLDKEDDTEGTYSPYQMEIETGGKFSRKASWKDLERFCGKEIDSNVLRDWIVAYQGQCFPEDLSEPNHTPKKCYIKDENGFTIYKDFEWKPVKLNLKPGALDVKEKWSKEVLLESFALDFSTDADKIRSLDKCDKEIISSLRKSKLAGHPLAMEMMKTDSEIVTEFKGMNSVTFGVFGTGGPSETDKETGEEIWKDVKTLRALLQNAEVPKKNGNSREAKVDVVANESYLKARVYYKGSFTNDVVTDHHDKFRDKQYWKFPIKYLFQYNDQPNAILLYEDIELRFFSDVRLAMQNKEWDWVRDANGRWTKHYNKKE